MRIEVKKAIVPRGYQAGVSILEVSVLIERKNGSGIMKTLANLHARIALPARRGRLFVETPDSTSPHVRALRDAQSVHDFMEDWGNRVLAASLIERNWNAEKQHHHPDVHELRRAQNVRRKHQEDDDL